MRILKGIILAVLALLLSSTGCSRKPSLTFCAKRTDDLTQIFSKSTNVLNYSEIEAKKYEEYFLLLIKGTLPLGQINIKAIHISNGKREPAFILPGTFQNDDPRANRHAIAIAALWPFREDPPYTGHYYIFLEKDGVELAGSELLIR